MRLLSVAIPLLCATAITSSPLSIFDSQSVLVEDDKLNVPGKNPLQYCADPADYILSIDFVDLSPNPPVPGQILNITASGTLSKQVEEGAQLHIEVKYGLITLVKKNLSMCDQVSNVDLQCPLKAGKTTIEKGVEIPKEVPPGKYTVMAHAWQPHDGGSDEDITCLQSQIVFHR